MSELRNILEIKLPKYPGLPSSNGEVFTVKGFVCSHCNGSGSFRGKQISHDEYDRNLCPVCKGYGRLQAHAVVKWEPDENG